MPGICSGDDRSCCSVSVSYLTLKRFSLRHNAFSNHPLLWGQNTVQDGCGVPFCCEGSEQLERGGWKREISSMSAIPRQITFRKGNIWYFRIWKLSPLILSMLCTLKLPRFQFEDCGFKEPGSWTSLVAQWLRIRLPMQETQVRFLVREDPTCCGATKPVCHNY